MLRKKIGLILFCVFIVVSSLFVNTKAQYLGGIGGGYASAESAPDILLPVELVSFQAKVFDNQVLLIWITATEINNMGFEVQKKINAYWSVLDFVKGHGSSTTTQTYNFTDDKPQRGMENSYRLKQIDYNGLFNYSDIVLVSVPFEGYSLEQNYPNPFNPSTIIRFNIKSATRVRLEVYNLIGEQVGVLIDGNMDEGTHEVEFDGRNLPSGVYAYRLEAGEFLEVKLMSLMK